MSRGAAPSHTSSARRAPPRVSHPPLFIFIPFGAGIQFGVRTISSALHRCLLYRSSHMPRPDHGLHATSVSVLCTIILTMPRLTTALTSPTLLLVIMLSFPFHPFLSSNDRFVLRVAVRARIVHGTEVATSRDDLEAQSSNRITPRGNWDNSPRLLALAGPPPRAIRNVAMPPRVRRGFVGGTEIMDYTV
ncbi:hypothetical protein VTO73DRAFT_14657 [Trametes versicolor]